MNKHLFIIAISIYFYETVVHGYPKYIIYSLYKQCLLDIYFYIPCYNSMPPLIKRKIVKNHLFRVYCVKAQAKNNCKAVSREPHTHI